jgi:ribose transport system permease protein
MSEKDCAEMQAGIKFRRFEIRSLIPYIGFILVSLLFIAWTKGGILAISNIEIIITQVYTTLMIGCGAIFVYAYGGMDFSMTSIMGLASYVIVTMTRAGRSVYLALIVAVFISVVCEVIVGFSAATLKIPLIIISLAYNYIYAGVFRTLISSAGQTLFPPSDFSGSWSQFWVRIGGLVIVILGMWFIYEKTRLGKYNKLIGGNETAAALGGINVLLFKVLAHFMLGISIGIASLFSVARSGAVTAASGGGVALMVMLALILGGVPVSGGKDTKMIAVIIGAFTINVLSNGFLLIGLDQFAVEGITGAIFILVLVLTFKRIKGTVIL